MALTKEAIQVLSQSHTGHDEPDWMLKKRLEAFKLFEQLELPELRYGLHIFSTYGDLDINNLDFGVGEDSPQIQAPPEVTVQDFRKALQENPGLIREYFMNCIKADENKFTALHAAFWKRGVLIHVPKGLEVKEPVQIKLKATHNIIDHVLIISEPMSKINVIEEVISQDGRPIFRSGLTEIYAKENAQVQYASIQNYGLNVFNSSIKRAIVARDANVNWLDCVFGSNITISDVSSFLKGNGARSNNWAVFYGDEKQHYDFSMKSVHEAPDTVSDMLTKGALADEAKSIYRGSIKIAQNAARSNGYQKEDTLLLSDKAEVDSIPKLEIGTNDVKCSHGAAIGQIDEDKLFYMVSRGIPESLAKRKIVEGFFHPMLKQIAIKELRNNLIHMIDKRMS